MPALRHIGLSLGLIDSLSDGLGEFSTQLCERVAAAAPAWRRDHGVQFHLHLPRRWHGRFGPEVGYLVAKKAQGHLHLPGLRRFDLWHGLNQLGRIGPPLGTRHSLLTIHDLNTIYYDDAETARRQMAKLANRVRKFERLTTLTHHVEGDIRRHLGWTGQIDVIPNGARNLVDHARDSLPALVPGRFLLHLSRLSASKNPQALLELARVWPEQTIVLAGPRSAQSDALRSQAQALGLQELRVISDVSDAQKSWLYANCAAFLFPSLTEGFGLPPLEAMHFGKPVFLSRLTSLPEIGGDAAAYFDSFDALSMRYCIETRLPLLAARADDIRRHASRFTWDRAFEAYTAIYLQILQPT